MKKELEKYIRKRKYWRTKPREVNDHPIFRPKAKPLACIDPNTYKLIKIFDSIRDMEYDTNTKNLQPILYRYLRNKHGKNGTPTIMNWIVVDFTEEEINDMSQEDFQELIKKKAIDKIIFAQLQRIRNNIESFTKEEKQIIFNFLDTIDKNF